MEAAHIVIDTSIVIEHLRKHNKRKSILYNLPDEYTLYVPTIVEFELFVGATDEKKHQDIQDVLQLCTTLPFTSDVAWQAAMIYQMLRRQNQMIDIRDILIAATAIAHRLPLMTLNSRHFERIEGLQLLSS